MAFALQYHRIETFGVRVGNIVIGGGHPIVIQSMADTSTNDIEGSVVQSKRLIESGVQMIRFTTQGERELRSLSLIKEQLRKEYDTPLIADVHFRSDIAEKAVFVADKVRINPGNYSPHYDTLERHFSHFLAICKERGIAVRIGVNHGSLSKRILSRYGNTSVGMVESCMEFLRIARKCHFEDIVISMKASESHLMYDTVLLLREEMERHDMFFPLHVGVTEAGMDMDGRIKSAVGIGAVLAKGLGDTIRVSLSESPLAEIPVARTLVDYFVKPSSNRYTNVSVTIEKGVLYYAGTCSHWDQFVIESSAECGYLLWEKGYSQLVISNMHFSEDQLYTLSRDILQACGIIRYKNEYVSCPGCGRTMFDLQGVVGRVRAATSHLTGLKIAVMGCIVNGIGEMGDADYGYVGAGRNKVSLYKNGQCVMSNIDEKEAVDQLLTLIENK